MITDKSLILMKFGVHASEQPYDVIKRKEIELKDNGLMYWGYGSSLLDPINVIQPFCKEYDNWVYMIPTTSHHFGIPNESKRMSIDKFTWTEVPKSVSILGSKKALICDMLQQVPDTH